MNHNEPPRRLITLEGLEARVAYLERALFAERARQAAPDTPAHFRKTIDTVKDTCPKCALQMGNVSGYVCMNASCPLGLGGPQHAY